MPITKVILENFKGVGERVEIPLRAITLLFGANSAGKSTILQSMLYLRELLERRNADADTLQASGQSIDLGGFKNLVHKHDVGRVVRIGASVTVDDDGLREYPVARLDDDWPAGSRTSLFYLAGIKEVTVAVSVQWDSVFQRAHFKSFEVEINGKVIGKITADIDAKPVMRMVDEHPIFAQVFNNTEPDNYLGYVAEQTYLVGGPVVPQWGSHLLLGFKDGESNDSSMLSLEDAEELFSHVMVGAGECVLNELKRLRYIGPMRMIPQRGFRPVLSPDSARWADGSAAWDLLHLQDDDLAWFDQKQFASLGLGYQIGTYRYFEVARESTFGAALYRAQFPENDGLAELDWQTVRAQLIERSRLQILAEDSQVEVDPVDIGVGVSQLVPVVVGVMAPGYSLLSVEQPELHVHPAIQCRLADVLAHQVIGRERQVLLETHSEHLMLRLLRRVRETAEDELTPDAPKLHPTDLSVLYVTNEPDGLKITVLPVNAEGDFDKQWPKGFFEERAAELF